MQSSQVNSFLDIFSEKKTKKDFTNAIKCSLGFGTEHVFTVRSTVWLYSIHKIKQKAQNCESHIFPSRPHAHGLLTRFLSLLSDSRLQIPQGTKHHLA